MEGGSAGVTRGGGAPSPRCSRLCEGTEGEAAASAQAAGLLASGADGLPQTPHSRALQGHSPPPASRPALSGAGILTPSAHNLGPRNRSKRRHHSRLCEPSSHGPVEFPDLHPPPGLPPHPEGPPWGRPAGHEAQRPGSGGWLKPAAWDLLSVRSRSLNLPGLCSLQSTRVVPLHLGSRSSTSFKVKLTHRMTFAHPSLGAPLP